MTTRLTWSEVDARWPGASVLWDRDVAGEGWEPALVVRDGVLWTVEAVEGAQCARDLDPWGRGACRCRAWIPNRGKWWTHLRWEKRDIVERLNDDLRAGRLKMWSAEVPLVDDEFAIRGRYVATIVAMSPVGPIDIDD